MYQYYKQVLLITLLVTSEINGKGLRYTMKFACIMCTRRRVHIICYDNT